MRITDLFSKLILVKNWQFGRGKRWDNVTFCGTYFANILCHLVSSKVDFLLTKIRLTCAILDGFSWFKRHITPNIGQNILGNGNFYGIAKYVSRAWFMAILRNVVRTNKKVNSLFFNVHQIWKCHWILNFEWKIIVTHDTD